MGFGRRVVAASVTGLAHERAGVGCQDAVRWDVLANGVLVVAVADGAGSAERAQTGATVVVDTALDAIGSRVGWAVPDTTPGWTALFDETLAACVDALARRAEADAASAGDYAATLLVAIVTPTQTACLHVGDGAIVAGWPDGGLDTVALPAASEYVNETVFVTSPDVASRRAVTVWDRSAVRLAAFTDGVQPLALQAGGAPHDGFFAPLFEFVAGADDLTAAQERLGAFLVGDRVRTRTGDDCTLVIAVAESG